MSETALISSDRLAVKHLADDGDRRARHLSRMLEDPEQIITTVLVGNNIVNIGASVLSSLVALELFGAAGPAVAVGVMTFLVLVFAEITPKTLAVRHSQAIALRVAAPLRLIQILLRPLAWLFTGIARFFLRAFGVQDVATTPVVTQGQIETMVRVGIDEGEVEKFEGEVIREVFEFTETPVAEVMTPAKEVHFLDKEATLQEALQLAAQTGHSRIPIVAGSFDHVLGFVHAKDLLKFSDDELREEPVTDAIRDLIYAPHRTRSDRVLARMQRKHRPLAIITDDDGHNVGLATVEDLLEELVGEIHDEFDEEPAGRPGRSS